MDNYKCYTEKWVELSAKAILRKTCDLKSVKYSHGYKCHYAMADVTLGGRLVRLFFRRHGKSEGRKVLLTQIRGCTLCLPMNYNQCVEPRGFY